MTRNKLEAYWNLADLLYRNKILKVVDFQALLKEHGVSLSYSQAHGLVNEQPLRVTMRTIAGICEMLNCSVSDLIIIRPATEKAGEPEKKKKAAQVKRISKNLTGGRLKFD